MPLEGYSHFTGNAFILTQSGCIGFSGKSSLSQNIQMSSIILDCSIDRVGVADFISRVCEYKRYLYANEYIF